VLIPLLFMGDVVGRLFREFAVSLAVTIVLSAVVALTAVPMLAARLLRPEHEERRLPLVDKAMAGFDRLAHHYSRALDWVIERPRATLTVFALSLAVAGVLFWVIPKNLFPVQDTGQLRAIVVANSDVSFQQMAQLQQQVATQVLKSAAVASLSSAVGVDGQNAALDQGRMIINLKPIENRGSLDAVTADIAERAGHVAGVQVFLQPVQDLTIDTETGLTPYRFSLQGADADLVNTWAGKLADKLRDDPSLTGVNTASLGMGRAVFIDVNRDSAARLGMSSLTVDNALYDAFGQRIISTIYTQSSQSRVILSATPGMLSDPSALARFYIPLGAGTTQVALGTVATIREGWVPLELSRQNQFPSASIGFDLAPGVSLGTAVSSIEKVESEIGLPISVSTDFSGAASVFRSALSNEVVLVLAAILVVYIVLGVLYESFIHPITIISTLPSAGVGALIVLLLSGYGLGVIGIIGIVLLIGIVKKNAIMMIDFAVVEMREKGHDPLTAIRSAALLRFRPIMMTTFAALFAAVPMIFGTGMGHELRQPLGLSIAGGLILSQVLTLFTTPVIFLAFENMREARVARLEKAGPGKTGVTTGPEPA
jgi:multidrug efflux pump